MKLQELLQRLPSAILYGDPSLEIGAVAHDSRALTAGALFVAIPGLKTDGNQFVEQALKRGALAIASEQPPREGVTWIQVRDAREALAVLSAAFLGDPAERLELVGVTGTNGKTTTTYLIDAALRAAGKKVGLVGTIQYRIGERAVEAVRTTPESSDLQALFREMVDAGCSHAVLEVSSHSLALKRVHGCRFTTAVFTNLTRDHLDFHGDMEGYFAAKRILFESLIREDGVAVLNADDERSEALRRATRARIIGYGFAETAEVRALDVRLSIEGSRFRARTPQGEFAIDSPLLGRFNVQNLLAALATALGLGLDAALAVKGILSVSGVPGRMERVFAGQDFAIIVDYAHTDDALRNLLETVRGLKPRRVITVFGCGGDRDKSKRPLMGAVASRLSDVIVVTSDNPRSEPPEAIIEEILLGVNGGRGAERHVIVDRREAIARALELAQKGDAVVIAGKGHETYQQVRDRKDPFDDRQVARELVARLLRSAKA